ncbi:predicted sodium-dependent mannose transporter [Algibacter lectus]|uniref:Predicted sodium-dependent mannose transporter n=1 Tax=Algibacter lectus TaxID=221126 RepID=A0A090VHQ3_9FLAO|nr:predicted sodium-dependent mannose transporter [Algibacter lectus]
MHSIDVIIIVLYILLTLGVGIWISKRASKGLDSYFLGGKSIKWYYLGLSNGSGMFDVSGTAGWLVYSFYMVPKVSCLCGCGQYGIKFSSWFSLPFGLDVQTS